MDKKELSIVYCPTHIMLASYSVKPLQGALLHKFRDIIMVGISPFTLLENTFSYTSKERVGKQIPPEDIPLGTEKSLKETKKMIEYENDK